MREPYQILYRPLVTEKSTISKEANNQVTFEVAPGSNKIEIMKAVEKAFGVRVMQVRTMNFKGKKKRLGRFMGRRANWKKAVVTLAPGESIDFFEGV
jgi:large subunit ribosomal protein L23